jgi:hypothetical protein
VQNTISKPFHHSPHKKQIPQYTNKQDLLFFYPPPHPLTHPTHAPTYINFKVKHQQLQKKCKNPQSSSLDSSPKTHIFVKCVLMHTKQKLFSPSSTPLTEA